MPNDLITPQDPRSQYPGPPSSIEIQSAPATQQAMKEKPDCGELSYKGSGRLAGRTALLTGADSGIGRAAAIAFAREGADIAICYLPEEQADAEEVAEYIRAAGRKAVLLPGDVSHEGFCQRLVADAIEQLGGLDILVNNAGRMGKTEGLLETSTERFDTLMKTNIYSIFWITKAAVAHLKPGASIINTTSIQAYEPSANVFDYAITKAAIANFTKGLSEPLMEKYGIRINAVAPGPIWTPLQEADGDEKKLKKLGESTPYKRPGQPIELAPCVRSSRVTRSELHHWRNLRSYWRYGGRLNSVGKGSRQVRQRLVPGAVPATHSLLLKFAAKILSFLQTEKLSYALKFKP